ncbi:lantibiotic dehydratase family protein [Streptomyces sp. NPDC088755]|uniref:lantibiotic dehydratase family protein n=1 Tax=Streptomyces sp. NPDC088755 TaxID=3365888 RepID=UPI0038113C39
MTRHRLSLYEAAGEAMLRAAVHTAEPAMPPWPTRTASVDEWRAWLTTVWSDIDFRRTVSQASPHLADQVQAIIDGRTPKVRRMRRAALSTARYAIRYTRRSTPYGLFAGVAPLGFAQTTSVRIGDEHQAVARPEPTGLEEMLSNWESDAARMADAEVCVNTLIQQRDQHIHVPSEGAAEFRVALNAALRLVLDLARSPIGYGQLSDKLAAEFPTVSDAARDRLIGDLLRVRLLRSSLRAPATVTDPTDVLPPAARAQAAGLRTACDLRLDADVRLPEQVLTEVETAATVLARLVTHPTGTPTWQQWIERFTEFYGENTVVPVDVATDPERGVGFPAGFLTASEPPRAMSRRDRLLLELAGTAAAEGSRTVALTEAMVEELEAAAGKRPHNLAPHLELAAQVHASSMPALNRGDFRLRVLTVSRSAGSMTGRFWHLLPGTEAAYTALPTVDPEAELAQLSFHAGRVPADLLTRAPQALPRVVSVGEFRSPDPNVLFPRDLSVTVAGGGRPQLVETATGKPLELLAPTAINFQWNNYTPPMARFLGEISRAASPQVTWFDWGAAWALPFTPALTYRRTILTAARWKIRNRILPDRTAPLQQWAVQLHSWRARFRVPEQVLLAEDDQHLALDLTRDVDLDLLRAHLDASPVGIATLHDAPPPDADGWIGGRAHSIVVPLARRS